MNEHTKNLNHLIIKMIDRDDFVPDEGWERFREISKDFPTPNIFVNLDTIEAEYKHVMKNV